LRPSPNANDRSAAGPRTEAKAPSAENARAQIMRIMWDRKSSETMIVGYWRYVPLVAVSLGALTGFAFFVLAPSVVGFVFGYLAIYSVCFAILTIINYKLVKAMNAHFRREAALRPLLIDIARQRSAQSPTAENREAITKMERLDHDASKMERPKNEMMSAMSALPIVGIGFGYYFLRSLMAAQAEHERNWSELLSLLNAGGLCSGKGLPSGNDRKTRKANFAAYLVISLLCFPFLAYWYNDFDKRAELHLRAQWQSEDQLAKALQ
jgi:hypothetical protein